MNQKTSRINMLLPLLSDTVKYNSDVSGHKLLIEFLLNRDRGLIILYFKLHSNQSLINMYLKRTLY